MSGTQTKFQALILYLALKSETDPRFGAVKLAKLLLYCDLRSLQKFGCTLTEARYQKLPNGPAPRDFLPAVQEMTENDLCTYVERHYFEKPQKRLVAKVEPDLRLFSAPELDLINRVLDELWEHNATQVSDLSHNLLGWQLAEYGEDIPLGTIFVGEPRELTPKEVEMALGLPSQK